MSDFAPGSDLHACAGIVEKGDPERFMACMAAPVAARRVLFPIYAFNVEVARAPWVTAEPMIAQMRLQWWADALDEIAQGGPVRRHEVVAPLAEVLPPPAARRLGILAEARRQDIERAPFDDEAALLDYIDRTAGFLAQSAVEALGGAQALLLPVAIWARAAGLARYMQAVPELEARGKLPLPDGRPEAVARMARTELVALRKTGGSLRGLRRRLGPQAGAGVLEMWQARAVLRQIARDPAAVAEGRVGLSGFGGRARLLSLAF
jgi:phytoene/squalene synthetase